MPTYVFRNSTNDETIEKVLKISELEAFKAANPHLEIVLGAVAFGDPVRLGIRRIDNGFREVLQKVADTTPGGKGLRDNIR